MSNLFTVFFERVPSHSLGLFRILVALLILITFLYDAPHIAEYYSDEGIVPQEAVEQHFRQFRFSLLDYIQSPLGVYAAYFLLLASAFFLMFGFHTRLAAILTFVLLLSFHERNWLILHSGDSLLRVMVFYLMVTDSGASLSVDAARKGERLIPRWQRWLIQFQVSVFYFFAGLAKTAGPLWLNGTAVHYALSNDVFTRFSFTWLGNAPLLLNFLTWGALFIELSVPFLLWFRATRLPALVLAVALQLGILVTMNIGTFQLISMAKNQMWNV